MPARQNGQMPDSSKIITIQLTEDQLALLRNATSEAIQIKDEKGRTLGKIFQAMSIVGLIDFLDLAAVFVFKHFTNMALFLGALPYLMLETGLAALFNITAFWLVANNDRYPHDHAKAGQMKGENVFKAIMMTIGGILIATAGIFSYPILLLNPFVVPIFTASLAIGSAHNIFQFVKNAIQYRFSQTQEDIEDRAGKTYMHFFIALALTVALIGVVGSNFGFPFLAPLAILGGLIGAAFSASNLLPEKWVQPVKNVIYKCLLLNRAIPKEQGEKPKAQDELSQTANWLAQLKNGEIATPAEPVAAPNGTKPAVVTLHSCKNCNTMFPDATTKPDAPTPTNGLAPRNGTINN